MSELIKLRQVRSMEDVFENLMNLLPACWLLNFLLFVSGYIVLIKTGNQALLILESSFLVWLSIIHMVTFALIVQCQNRHRSNHEYLVDLLLTHNVYEQRTCLESNTRVLLIRELNKRTYLTGLSQFDIKPSLFLSFVGSVISFSVLFIQFSL